MTATTSGIPDASPHESGGVPHAGADDVSGESTGDSDPPWNRVDEFKTAGRSAEAGALLTDALRDEPDDPDLYAGRGHCRYLDGKIDAAEAHFDEALRLDPEHLRATTGRGMILCDRRKYARAVLALDGVEGRSDPDPDEHPGDRATALLWRGYARHGIGDLDGAIADFTASLALRESASALRNRGSARRAAGDPGGAVADLTAALTLEPDDGDVLKYRAEALTELDRRDEALADLTRAIELTPDEADALLARARLRARADDRAGAADDFGAVIGLDPSSADALAGRADVLDALGRTAEADADRDRLDRLDGSPPDTRRRRGSAMTDRSTTDTARPGTTGQLVPSLLRRHFHPQPYTDLEVVERRFPLHVRADLQRAIDALTGAGGEDGAPPARPTWSVEHFSGVRQKYSHDGLSFGTLTGTEDPARTVPPQFEQVDVGEDEPVRCATNGLWLLSRSEEDEPVDEVGGGDRPALLLEPGGRFAREGGLRIQVAAPATPDGRAAVGAFLKSVGEAVERSDCYRGKILSLERTDRYSGESGGITVHALRRVCREQVILPERTLDLLDRNVLRFVEGRDRLRAAGLPTKKGLLFYGPPGTGKTHTIHYLAGALPGHTTLLITAEQAGLLSVYMTLARLLAPSLVVIEDVDLIARDREEMDGGCGEALLNRLLNEMDGLRPDADILFVLTTNRPGSLESALAGRPGRVDQAIEFPPPDDAGRRKLVRLYARGATVGDATVAATADRTGGVSAAFLRELMRRAAQFALEREPGGANRPDEVLSIETADVEAALDELLVAGGSLNRALLGAGSAGG